MSMSGSCIARIDGVRFVEIVELSDADRAAARRLASSGNLYAHPVRGYRGLLGDELRRLTALEPGDAQGLNPVITFGSGGRDLGDGWAKIAGRLDRRHQGPNALHFPVVVDHQLHGQIDGQLHQALGQRHFSDKLGLGRFVHRHLHGLMTRLKALFRGSVE